MRHIYILFFCILGLSAAAQNTRVEHQAKFQLRVVPATDAPKIDGALDEAIWQSAPRASDFSMKWPRDGGPAPEQTSVQCAADNQFLYIAVTASDSTPDYVIQSLKRDASYWDSDGIAILLDPTNAANNGYFFGLSPNGVQSEGLVAGEDLDWNWDNVWYSKTKNYPTYWTAEIAIPLRILRFKGGQTTWGINIIRNDLTNSIYSTWAPVPFQFDGIDLGWVGAMNWDQAPQRVKGNYNIIPYLSGGITRDFEAESSNNLQGSAGVDAKIGIGSGLNLDVTLNPDFSQIEIDEQVVNLTRFNVQLPEKRTFFLENADIFGSFGIPPVRPFFSRQIGLTPNGTPVPILGGLRLSGNLNADTRIGVMTMHTRATSEQPASQYSAVSLRRRLFGRSTVSGYFLDRESFAGSERLSNAFSRNAGAEGLFVTTDGKWQTWQGFHYSGKPGVKGNNWWGNLGGGYTGRKFNMILDLVHVGDNYYADMGFEQRIQNYDIIRDTVLRIGYNFIFSEGNYRIFPKKEGGNLNFLELGYSAFQVLNPDASLNESSNRLEANWNFKNTSEITIGANHQYSNVPVAFKFDDAPLSVSPALPATEYQFFSGDISIGSDYRKPYFISVTASGGQFYNGTIYGGTVEASLRYKTLGTLRLAAQYNKIEFPQPYSGTEVFNLTPRLEVFFSKQLWWTTFLQYNTQAGNFNINSRLQWRFRPMSDLFVVYTDNYTAATGDVRYRGLVAKVNYWF
jgi:Domain of unknown function (DUF5916)/Carbohydrate family 9 binding domain-like